jgi:hypothetical protein
VGVVRFNVRLDTLIGADAVVKTSIHVADTKSSINNIVGHDGKVIDPPGDPSK